MDSIYGRCLTMCSPEEIRRRQNGNLVHPMECRPPQSLSHEPAKQQKSGKRNKGLIGNSELFVKEFSRSAAGQQNPVSAIRPVPVLSRTLRYLLTEAVLREDLPESMVLDFICDRLRAVVKDLTLQSLLQATSSTPLLAACARYHIFHHYRMCRQADPEFDGFTHLHILEDIVKTLVRQYHDDDAISTANKQSDITFVEEDCEESASQLSTECEKNSLFQEPSVDRLSNQMANVKLSSEDMHSPILTSSPCNINLNADTRVVEQESVNENSPWTNISCDSQYNSFTEEQVTCRKSLSLSEVDIDERVTERSDSKDGVEYCCVNEREEMECAYLLLFFYSEEALQHAMRLPEPIRQKFNLLKHVISALRALQSTGNFVPLMRLLRLLPPLLSCCLLLNLKRLQLNALRVLNLAHSSRNTKYPVVELVHRLEFKDETEARAVCWLCGLKLAGESEEFVAFSKDDFQMPEGNLGGPLARAWLDEQLSSASLPGLFLPYPLPLH